MKKKTKAIVNKKGSPAPGENYPKYKTDNLITYVVLLYFVILFGLVHIFQDLDLSILDFFRFLLITIGISFFIPIIIYRKRWQLSYYEYSIFNVIFVGPLILLLAFLLNIGFRSAPYTETHKIVKLKFSEDKPYTMLKLENDKYEDKGYLRKVSDFDEVGDLRNAKELKIKFSDGLLGIRMIEERKVE